METPVNHHVTSTASPAVAAALATMIYSQLLLLPDLTHLFLPPGHHQHVYMRVSIVDDDE